MLTSEERGKISAIQRRLKQQQDAIAADAHLSPGGKRAARAREQLAAEQANRQIVAAADARHSQALRDAHYRCFGLQATTADAVMVDRDARAFAAGLKTPGDALKALAAAELRGDGSMSRAIAERAWTQRGDTDLGAHWASVLGAYAGDNPQRQQNLAGYTELAEGDSRAARFSDSMYRHLPRPPDLQAGNIEAIAASADSAGAPEGA
jgi:hypothetical protein